ncbi:MAG: thiamine pyrophosphate-dependent dehydrogenase E1 component subunit alpha [Gemmatimonadetes bacterium]|nr:thiamine pyrophosphate-dependent dehydrogenase E1 component subunit alpha [Gemmatimonadota bacterium]
MASSISDEAPAGALVAGLTRADLHALYRTMVMVRASEERLEILQKQGLVHGGLYRSLGQEAGPVGAAYALRPRTDGTGDVLAQTVRATGACFVFGFTTLELFRQYLGRATSLTRGKEANLHCVDYARGFIGPPSPLGTMVQVMAGVTLTFRMKGEDRVGITFYGDGATSTGAWHEGITFAAGQRCPLIVMVEANQWAFSTRTERFTPVKSFADKGVGYGITGESVDGNDPVAVYEVVSRAAARARAGAGTQLVELRTYRRLGHAQHDAMEYMDKAELAAWEAKDPITSFRARLLAEGWAEPPELDGIDRDVHDSVAEDAARAVAEPLPEPAEALTNVYTDRVQLAPWTRRDPVEPRP